MSNQTDYLKKYALQRSGGGGSPTPPTPDVTVTTETGYLTASQVSTLKMNRKQVGIIYQLSQYNYIRFNFLREENINTDYYVGTIYDSSDNITSYVCILHYSPDNTAYFEIQENIGSALPLPADSDRYLKSVYNASTHKYTTNWEEPIKSLEEEPTSTVNLVTGKAVYDELKKLRDDLDEEIQTREDEDDLLEERIEDIEEVIPEDASADNLLITEQTLEDEIGDIDEALEYILNGGGNSLEDILGEIIHG